MHLLVEEHKHDSAARVMLDETLLALFAYHAVWGEFFQLQLEQANEAAEESRRQYAKTRALILVLMSLAGAAAIVVAMIVTRNTARDMAARVRAEQALSSLNKDLENRVTERTAELTAANERLRLQVEERKLVEASLRYAEDKYRRIFEEAVIGIFQGTFDRFDNVNPAMAHMFGYDSPEAFLSSAAAVPSNTYVDIEEYERIKTIAKQQEVVRNFQHQRYRKNGSKMWLTLHLRRSRDHAGGLRFEGMCADITEQKLLESELLQAQKMEAVGRLAGGVAHDFNNALMVISGYTELMQESLPPGLRGQGEEVLKATHRAASLTRQLLAFSRKQITQPTLLDLNSVVDDIEKMLRRLIGEDVELSIIKGWDLKNVKADRGQIEQVLMNLAVNARDAMPRGGKLVIETSNLELNRRLPQPPYVHAGDYIVLSVSDTGCGMGRETQAHIFEPFFTTKEIGKGTGLGLSTVYGIVKQGGGYISVYSEVGQGTTFRIYLPQCDARTGSDVQPLSAPVLFGTETVLLVEDDDALRALGIHSLQRHGYKVLDAANGSQAMDIAEKHAGPIHLLLTDVVMPGFSGPELANGLLSFRPEMKVLFMSGYTYELIVGHGVLDKEVTLVEKPFSIDLLLRTVREVLDGKLANAVGAN